ncbi:hypothetical protein FKM82_022116 [Ascaphus truei]
MFPGLQLKLPGKMLQAYISAVKEEPASRAPPVGKNPRLPIYKRLSTYLRDNGRRPKDGDAHEVGAASSLKRRSRKPPSAGQSRSTHPSRSRVAPKMAAAGCSSAETGKARAAILQGAG